jgi:hypothetical protein
MRGSDDIGFLKFTPKRLSGHTSPFPPRTPGEKRIPLKRTTLATPYPPTNGSPGGKHPSGKHPSGKPGLGHSPLKLLGGRAVGGDAQGLHCVRQIVDGEPLTGTWFDRTQEHAARRRRGEDPDPLEHTTSETVTFSPLPCWEHLPPEAYQERVGTMVSGVN